MAKVDVAYDQIMIGAVITFAVLAETPVGPNALTLTYDLALDIEMMTPDEFMEYISRMECIDQVNKLP